MWILWSRGFSEYLNRYETFLNYQFFLIIQVAAVCNEAALRALEQDIKATQICRGHFEFSLSVVTPRITSETVNFYENYVKESGLHAI